MRCDCFRCLCFRSGFFRCRFCGVFRLFFQEVSHQIIRVAHVTHHFIDFGGTGFLFRFNIFKSDLRFNLCAGQFFKLSAKIHFFHAQRFAQVIQQNDLHLAALLFQFSCGSDLCLSRLCRVTYQVVGPAGHEISANAALCLKTVEDFREVRKTCSSGKDEECIFHIDLRITRNLLAVKRDPLPFLFQRITQTVCPEFLFNVFPGFRFCVNVRFFRFCADRLCGFCAVSYKGLQPVVCRFAELFITSLTVEIDISLIEVILVKHQEYKGCAGCVRIGISRDLCRNDGIILTAAYVLHRVVFIELVVSFEICGQELNQLALYIRFCAVFKQHTEAGVPYRDSDIHAEAAFSVTVEAAVIIGRNCRKRVDAMEFGQEFRIVDIGFRGLVKSDHPVRQQSGKTAQCEFMVFVIGQLTVCRNHFLFFVRLLVEFRKLCPNVVHIRNGRTDYIIDAGDGFTPFRNAVYGRTECLKQFCQGRTFRVPCFERFDGRDAGLQEITVVLRPGIQVFLQVCPERCFAIHTVCALGVALSCEVHIVAAAAFNHRIAQIAGFLPLGRKTCRQRLIAEIGIVECPCLFKVLRGCHRADPFEHHPVAGRNVFLFCAEHLCTHGLDITRHDDTDVVHEVAFVIAGDNGSGRMFLIQYDQAVLLRKQTQRVGLPVIGFCQ